MIFLDHAPKYWIHGLSVIPLEGKAPFFPKWQQYCDEISDLKTTEKWCHQYKNHNIGLCMGPASGLVGLDVDIYLNTPDGAALYEVLKELIPYSPFSKTGEKAFTRLYQYDGEKSKVISLGMFGQIEVLSTGRQTVLPPSIHPDTGKPYIWNGEDITTVNRNLLPFLGDLTQLEERIRALNLPKTDKKSMGRNNRLKDIAWAMLSRGEETERLLTEILRVDTTSNNPPLFSDPTESQMRSHSMEENARKFCESIIKTFARLNPKRTRDEEPEPTFPEPELFSLDAFMSKDFGEIEWTVDGLVPVTGVGFIVAAPKVGKSTFCRDVALGIAHGAPIIGRQTKKSTVLFYAMEDTEAELQDVYRHHALDSCSNYFLRVGYGLEDGPKTLERDINKCKAKVIFIDTLEKYTNLNDFNDYSAVSKALKPYLVLAKKLKVFIFFIHHSSKDTMKTDASAILGSQAFRAASFCTIVLREGSKNSTVMKVEGRYTQRCEQILHFNEDTSQFVVQPGDPITQAAEMRENAVIEKLFTTNEPLTAEQLKAGLKGSKRDQNWVLKTLLKRGSIAIVGGRGVRGDPHLFSLGVFERMRKK